MQQTPEMMQAVTHASCFPGAQSRQRWHWPHPRPSGNDSEAHDEQRQALVETDRRRCLAAAFVGAAGCSAACGSLQKSVPLCPPPGSVVGVCACARQGFTNV